MRITLATKAFFAVLFDPARASKIQSALATDSSSTVSSSIGSTKTGDKLHRSSSEANPVRNSTSSPRDANKRSDALTLLSTLQRESHLIDLIMEPLENYSDTQIGAAARECLRDSSKVLMRLFDLKPLADEEEGATVTVPENASAMRWQLIGNSQKKSGQIIHPGWIAKHLQLPQWTGTSDDANVLSPIEVETNL